MKINLKIIGNILYNLIVLTLLLIATLVVISYVNIPGGVRLYTVKSGSMEPTIHIGSLVISRSADKYGKGDIITFKAEKDKDIKNPKYITTHRIHEIEFVDNQEKFITIGDANNTPDIESVSKESVLGKTLFSIPYLGYPIVFAKTREGLIFLIIIPAVIIVYSELISIKNETKRLLKERKKRKLSLKENIEVTIGEEEIKAEKWYKKLSKRIQNIFKK